MSTGRSAIAAASAVAAFVVLLSCVSAAPVEGSDSARFVFFSGSDIWHEGAFAYGGVLWSPDGLNGEGFTLKALLSGGQYRYHSGALGAQVTGIETVGQFLPGWRFKRGTLEVKVFAGLDVENHRLLPDDPTSSLRGHEAGIRGAFDLWYEPTPATMVAVDGSLSSIATGYSARAAFGWRAFDLFYAGPEVQAFACDGYSQLRFGAHLTALKAGGVEWSFAAGWAHDTDQRNGAYGRIGVLMRR